VWHRGDLAAGQRGGECDRDLPWRHQRHRPPRPVQLSVTSFSRTQHLPMPGRLGRDQCQGSDGERSRPRRQERTRNDQRNQPTPVSVPMRLPSVREVERGTECWRSLAGNARTDQAPRREKTTAQGRFHRAPAQDGGDNRSANLALSAKQPAPAHTKRSGRRAISARLPNLGGRHRDVLSNEIRADWAGRRALARTSAGYRVSPGLLAGLRADRRIGRDCSRTDSCGVPSAECLIMCAGLKTLLYLPSGDECARLAIRVRGRVRG